MQKVNEVSVLLLCTFWCKQEGWTSLMAVAHYGDADILAQLIEAKADMNLQNEVSVVALGTLVVVFVQDNRKFGFSKLFFVLLL